MTRLTRVLRQGHRAQYLPRLDVHLHDPDGGEPYDDVRVVNDQQSSRVPGERALSDVACQAHGRLDDVELSLLQVEDPAAGVLGVVHDQPVPDVPEVVRLPYLVVSEEDSGVGP